MLPTQLVGTYRQYKQDTDSVALWLASTAKACGYPEPLTGLERQAPKSGRLKGKQRTKAAAAKTGPKPEPAGRKTTKHAIAIKDFLPLANFIASRRDPAMSVADVFVTISNRLIDLRSGFGGRLSDNGVQVDPKSDEQHGYFVGIHKVDTSNDAPKVSTKDLGSRFAALSVNEPSQAFIESLYNTPHERPKARDEDPVSYEAEPQTSLEDVMFAFAALVNDLRRIRARIKWMWSNHREGVFDLAAAAVATNTAISTARGLIEDVAPLLNTQDGGAWGVVNQFYLITCLQKGYKVDQVYVANRKDNFNYDLYDLADECYAVAFRLLQSFADVLDPRDLPSVKEGMFGTYDRPSKTGREKFQKDQILLMELSTELITVIRLVPDYPVEDGFLREMRRFDKTPVVSFALVFAAQVFLDIHHTMRASTRQSFMAVVKETTVRSVKEVCDPVRRELHTPAYMDKESELPWVVGYVLMAASGVDGPRDPRLLNLAAEPCNAIVGSEAGELAIAVARMIGKDVEFKEEEEE